VSEVGLAKSLAQAQIGELDKKISAETEAIAGGGAADWTDYKRRVERRKVLVESRELVLEQFKRVIESDDD
jgi:vacuolar-type H+-ATPase subunit H